MTEHKQIRPELRTSGSRYGGIPVVTAGCFHGIGHYFAFIHLLFIFQSAVRALLRFSAPPALVLA